jgi:hypothetical protein
MPGITRFSLLLRATALFGALLDLSSCAGSHQPGFDMPGIVLWAWERPEDLRFIDARRTGVAFLAGTAQILPNGSVLFRPRMQQLQLPDGTPSIAVVRIESAPKHENPKPEQLLFGLKRIAALPDVRGLQIDFDARLSERVFYKTVIESIRKATNKPVGVTALASWCSGDRWLDGEPIAEAVPMFFRMGRNESRNMSVESAVCRGAIGLSMDEAWPAVRPRALHRIYVFNPRAWTRSDYLAALSRIHNWK